MLEYATEAMLLVREIVQTLLDFEGTVHQKTYVHVISEDKLWLKCHVVS